MHTYSTTEARAHFAEMRKAAKKEVVQITEHNRPDLALISWEVYSSIIETLDILNDKETMASLRRAQAEDKAGKGRPMDDILKEMGIED